MTPEERKLLIDTSEKLDKFLDVYYRTNFIDKTVFQKPTIFNDNISTDNTDGIKIGKTTDKLGIFGVTPVVQQPAITAPSGGGDAGVDTPARTAINTIRDTLQTLGLIL